MLRADVDGPRGPIQVFCTHLNWRLDQSDVRQAQVRAIAELVAGAGPRTFPPIVCGDFNAEPHSVEIELLTGQRRWRCRRPRAAGRLARRAPDRPGYTFANSNPYAASQLEWDRRLDYVFVGWPKAGGRGPPPHGRAPRHRAHRRHLAQRPLRRRRGAAVLAVDLDRWAAHGVVAAPVAGWATTTWRQRPRASTRSPGGPMPGHRAAPLGADRRGPVLARSEDFVPHHAALRRLICGPLLDQASALLGERAVLFKEKVNYKHPGGAGFAPHQDATAYRFVDHHVSCMVPLDPATEASGCLDVASGGTTTGASPPTRGRIDRSVVADAAVASRSRWCRAISSGSTPTRRTAAGRTPPTGPGGRCT